MPRGERLRGSQTVNLCPTIIGTVPDPPKHSVTIGDWQPPYHLSEDKCRNQTLPERGNSIPPIAYYRFLRPMRRSLSLIIASLCYESHEPTLSGRNKIHFRSTSRRMERDIDWAVSSSSHEKRNEGKDHKHHVVDRSRHGVPVGKILTERHSPKP